MTQWAKRISRGRACNYYHTQPPLKETTVVRLMKAHCKALKACCLGHADNGEPNHVAKRAGQCPSSAPRLPSIV
jgi:hypothetical protein